jgi:hypothetical protein
MLSRITAKFVSVVFASILSGTLVSTASYGAPPAADDCLSAPNGQAPEGSHWYYRIERGTKRHCWYVREQGQKVSQSAPSSAAPAAKPVAAKPIAANPEPAIRGTVANARAELPAASIRGTSDNPAVATPPPQPPQPPAGMNVTRDTPDQPAASTDISRTSPTIASRWPEPSSTAPSANQTQAAANADDTDMQPTSSVAAAAEPPPVVLAAASTEKPQSHSSSIPMLSIVMVGALSLAGLIGSAIVKFGGRRRQRRAVVIERDPTWDAISSEPRQMHAAEAWSSPPAPPVAEPRPRRPGFTMPRDLQMTDRARVRQDDPITEMLNRLAKSAAR